MVTYSATSVRRSVRDMMVVIRSITPLELMRKHLDLSKMSSLGTECQIAERYSVAEGAVILCEAKELPGEKYIRRIENDLFIAIDPSECISTASTRMKKIVVKVPPAVASCCKHLIISVTFAGSRQVPSSPNLRFNRLNVKTAEQHGRRFNRRALENWSRCILKTGPVEIINFDYLNSNSKHLW